MSESVYSIGRWRGVLADAVLLLFVAGLGLKAAYGAAHIRDVDLADECATVAGAAHFPANGLPPVESSPLYVLSQFVLIRCGAPLEDVPFFSWACLAVLLPCSVYLLARSLGAGRAAAVLAGGFIPATTLIDIWPYPMHLAAVVLTLGTALAARLPRAPATAVLGLTLLTATYVRPEYLYALYLFAPLAAVAAVRGFWHPESRRAALGSVALFTAAGALLGWALGAPWAAGSRSMSAFGQHYACNRCLVDGRTESPWNQWENYIRADFGDATTVGGALRNNPDAFFWHIGTNARRLPRWVTGVAIPRVDLSQMHQIHLAELPSRYPRTEWLTRRAVAIAMGCGLVGVVLGLWRWRRGAEEAARLPVGVLMLALIVAPGIAASLVVFPRFHYAIPTVVFATALAAAGTRHLPRPQWARSRAVNLVALGAVGVGLALFVPNRANGWCVQSRLGGGQRIEPVAAPSRACARAIRELDLRGQVVFLDISGARSFYSGFGMGYVDPFAAAPGERFSDFVRRTNVGVVVLEPQVLVAPLLRADPDARALAAGRESESFRVFPVEGHSDCWIAVRRDLLPPGK
jgi:hypothetical protein